MKRSPETAFNEALPVEIAEALDRARPRFGRLGTRFLYFPTIESTNDAASSLAAGPDAEGVVVIADAQTAGRGRLGRTWFSPPASGLYVSVVLTPARARTDPARATTLLTLAAGVALAEAIETVSGLGADLKWPNDLYVARRKLGGILAEAVPTDAWGSGVPRELVNIVIGYGINVAPAAFPPELGDRATSLESELGRAIDRVALLVETIAALARRYTDLLGGQYDAILDAWRLRAPSSTGARVAWTTPEGPHSGVTMGIDGEGVLLVRVGERVERIVAGELTWI